MVRQAVIAAAGFGTRFLPASKTVPKELLPIVGKPAIQYLVEEAVDSGIEEVFIVVRPGAEKKIAEHFAPLSADDALAGSQSARERLEPLEALLKKARVEFIPQDAGLPYGNGSPILAAARHLKDEHFVYMFGDDLVLSDVPCIAQMLKVFERHKPDAILGVQDVPLEETDRYAIITPKPGSDPIEVASIIEKPGPAKAATTLAQFGRFVLPREILKILDQRELGKGNELWLTDAIAKLCPRFRVVALPIEGTWLTMGDPLRFLMANVEYGLRDGETGKAFGEFLQQVAKRRTS
jgi:UTP--glucose-1-phosphate uridylyltransferase